MNHRIQRSGLIFLLMMYAANSYAIELPGVLQYERVVELSIPVSGVVSRVYVEEGQTVPKGELLLELEEVPFKARLDKIAADLRLLKAEREAIEKELNRDKELYQRMVLSTVSLDGTRLKFIRADSLWQAKKAEYKLAQYNFDKSHLLAPFAGKVIDRVAEPGQSIRVDMQPPVLFTLADTTDFIVETEVSSEKISSLTHGTKLEVRTLGKVYDAVVKSSTLLAPGRSLSQPARYRVRVKLDKTDADFRPGQAATLILPTAAK